MSSSSPGSSTALGSDDAAGVAAGSDGISTLRRQVSEAAERLAQVQRVVDLPAAAARLASLEHDAAQPDLWQDPAAASQLLAQLSTVRAELEGVRGMQSLLEDGQLALELAEDGLQGSAADGAGEVAALVSQGLDALQQLVAAMERWEVSRLLSGPYDDRGAVLSITAGAGGVDAMDWALMLERMYLRWAEAQGLAVRVLDRSEGEEAGLKSVELEVSGRHAYGLLKGEKGTHRLVRSSPFNAKGLRQTSFAGVEVMPVLGDMQVSLDIREADLQVSTMRSGGAGGQNVNKVETGVRITHVPTGLSVKCTQERSQLQNKAIAMAQLQAKLLVVLEEQAAAKVAEIRGDMVKAEWGQQIRSYVLHPYQLVKDTRTGQETSDAQGVLDGGLGAFITAYLQLKGRQASATTLSEASQAA